MGRACVMVVVVVVRVCVVPACLPRTCCLLFPRLVWVCVRSFEGGSGGSPVLPAFAVFSTGGRLAGSWRGCAASAAPWPTQIDAPNLRTRRLREGRDGTIDTANAERKSTEKRLKLK